MAPEIQAEIIRMVEESLKAFVGPVARFVISKQLNRIGKKPSDMDEADILRFIELAAEAAVFDPEKRIEVIRSLKKEAKNRLTSGG